LAASRTVAKASGSNVVELLAIGQLLAELDRLRRQILVGHRRNRRLERPDLRDDRLHRLHVTVVGRTKNGLGNAAEHMDFPVLNKVRGRRGHARWIG
jgi:hypothetical protein